MKLNSSLLAGVVGAALMLTAGCGQNGPKIASVEGTITLDGQPLANATVVFNPENGRPAGASTDENGHYVLNFAQGRRGAIPGKNRVIVTTVRDPGVDRDGNPVPGSGERIPMKYNAKSELSFVVEDGKNNIADFKLDSNGKLARYSAEN